MTNTTPTADGRALRLDTAPGRYVLPLADCTADRADEVGGKAKGLGALMGHGLQVPDGFAITVGAYREVVEAAGLEPQIARLLAEGAPDPETSAAIIALFADIVIPDAVATEILAGLDRLPDGPVAVRSSAIAEDTAEASFAGQQDTYLWIEGPDAVLDAVVRCWASLFTSQAIGYRRRFDIAPGDVAMAVVVQQMVPAEAAGVTMTLEPVTGDTSQIYVESAFGLGEGVVKGDVETDRAWLDKATLDVLEREIGSQEKAHLFHEGHVQLVVLPVGKGAEPSLDDATLHTVGDLARRIEQHFGQAMDIEWAVDAAGTVHLLQARPETVWANRAAAPDWREPNTMNDAAGDTATWTTTNAAEAIPGVQTPLGKSLMGPGGEYGFRNAFYALGALSKAETAIPTKTDEQLLGIFFGRAALNLNVLCSWGDRIPGTSGRAMAEGVFSHVPVGYVESPQRRYYPRVAAKIGAPFFTYPGRVRKDRHAVEAFWRDAQQQLVDADMATAVRLLLAGRDATHESFIGHITLVMGVIQPSYDLLDSLATSVGLSGQALMSGHGGHEETAVLDDVWAAAEGRLTLDEFLLRHGHHGTNEGDVSVTVWREDPEPVRRLIESYRKKGIAPSATAGDRSHDREAAEKQFLAALPAPKRVMGRLALRMASKYMPMRGVGKVAFLQGIDVVRAAARRIGTLLVADGVLDTVDDAFFLTIDELEAGVGPDARAIVAERRALHAYYLTIDVPVVWRGRPEPATVEFDPDAEMVTGTGASPGVVEGIARVVTDPATAEIAEGEILVATCTDPSWASLMFLSAGLIADIGGVMSHTAVVAREMSIPCVVNTKIAMHAIKDGDRVRMDGSTGQIQIVERA